MSIAGVPFDSVSRFRAAAVGLGWVFETQERKIERKKGRVRTWILSRIQFTSHFIDFFVVHTKRFVGTFCKRDLDAANLRPAL